MKTLKLLGIIALSAIITIGFFSCEPPGEALEGSIVIRAADDYGNFPDKAYTAVLVGSNASADLLDFKWFKAGQPLWDQPSIYPGANTQTYTPTSSGNFTVTATPKADSGFNADDELRGGITIYEKPEYINMLGTWKQIGADNGNYKPSAAAAGTIVDETIVIKNDKDNITSFSLTSTYNGEFLQFTITGWEKFTGAQISGYQEVFKLTCTGASSEAYTKPDPRIYYLARGTKGTPAKGVIDVWFQNTTNAGFEKWEQQSGGTPRSFFRQ